MKRILTLLLALVTLLAGMTALLVSCADKDEGPGADIHLFLSNRLYDFDPTGALLDDEHMQVLSLLYEPLFHLNEDGTVVDALAEDYEIDEEAHTMTITLRKTNWSDATPVTSNDLVYAWQRILSPDFESMAAPLLYDIKNAVQVKQGSDAEGNTLTVADLGLEAPDDETLVITFRGDVDYDAFLRNLTSVALAPIPEKTVSNVQYADNWSKRVATIVTNGTFTLKSLDYQSGEFTLQRNQYYRRDKGSDTALTEYVLPQFLTSTWQTKDLSIEEYEEFLNKEIVVHFAGTEGDLLDSLYYMSELPIAVRQAGTFKDQTKVNDLLSVSTFVLNTSSGNRALKNVDIRQALSLVLDRGAIAEELVYAKPANGFITPGVYEAGKADTDFRTEENALLSADADKTEAEKLIARGMTMLGMKDKSELGELRVMYAGDSVNEAYIAKAVKTAWESLGFTVILDPLYSEYRNIGDDIIVLDSALQMNYNAAWNDIRPVIPALDKDEAEDEEKTATATPKADVILIDYQMLTTDPFVSLAGFSSTMSGNGFDKTDKTGNKEYNYAPVPHVSGYKSLDYDRLIDLAFAETDAAKRSAYLHSAEEILLGDMPIIPVVYNQDFYVISDKLADVTANAYGFPQLADADLTNYLENVEKAEAAEDEEETVTE